MRIIIAGTVHVKPKARERAIEAGIAVAAATRSEQGCIDYRFYADLENPTLFFVFEVWETEAALTAHFQTDHLKAFQAMLPEFIDGEMNIQRYDIQNTSRL
jgi:quinol monooxygenase YgiN